jgi:tRNA threonylcarbamoyladenosine biosynthesis protein TsaB
VILAIDTTHEFGSIALLDRGAVLEEELMRAPDGFGHVLYEHLERMLDRHGVRVQEIDCFAAAAGPGSFTGVRVGLACVKGLAEAVGKPVAAVSNLQALAAFGASAIRAPLLDARRGEIYGGLYDAGLNCIAPERVMNLAGWLLTLPAEVEFVSTDFSLFALPAGARMTTAPCALASAIARIAADRLQRGTVVDPSDVDANYVRRSDAELLWKEP